MADAKHASVAGLVRKGEAKAALMPPPTQQAAPLRPRAPKLGTIAVTVRLDPDRYERLKAQAAETRRSNQDIIVAALDGYWGVHDRGVR
jgi:hypothetical protein